MFDSNLRKLGVTLAVSLLALSACAPPQTQDGGPIDPEKATGFSDSSVVIGKTQMLVAANPHATRNGYAVLERGGTVIDAAIAVQATLTLVEPQSSGIGGGAFILYWDAADKKMYTFDAREVAPAAATADLFVENGAAVSWKEAIVGGRAVGVPGVLKGLELAHSRYGKLPWNTLFDDAADLAEQGFLVSPRLSKLVAYRFHPGLYQLEPAASYFYPDGESLAEGELLKNPQLAQSLRDIAEKGADYFYGGKLAQQMVAAAQSSAIAPGQLSLADLANYSVREREPVCAEYRVYRLCGMGQPSSGGLAILQMLRLLEPFDMQQYAPDSVEAIHLFSQASRLAFADRDLYSADPDFVPVPVAGLLDDDYLQRRGEAIDLRRDMGQATAGVPEPGLAWAQDDAYELPSTSHISIVDQYGNALSMTSSVEMAFGSSVMVGGFLLNNQLTDFSLSPEVDGLPVANRVEAGKRPRSSMSPFIVFDQQGELRALVGSPGGSRIINYVAKTLLGLLDWDLSMQEAIKLPNMTHRNDYLTLEKGLVPDSTVEALRGLGHEVKVSDLNSGVHAISVERAGLVSGVDPRREGLALGD